MRQTIEYAKMAFQNILGNKMRSILTMLGIIIGISSVIIVLSIGAGGQQEMKEQLSGFASGSVNLYAWGEGSTYADHFTGKDVEMIKNMPEVVAVTPNENHSGTVRGTKEELGLQVDAGTEGMHLTRPSTILYGRKWEKEDYDTAKRVCMIDSNGAKELFGSDNVVGMPVQLTVNGKTSEFIIVGVTKSSTPASGRAVTVQLRLPITSLYSMLGYEMGNFYYLSLVMQDGLDSNAVADQIVKKIEIAHDNIGRENYMVEDLSSVMDEINNVTTMFTGIIAAIAGISLLVGGIGIMNIMLVSVTERTREIGIRKALGAKTHTILFQFLIESATLTLVGGIIGIVFGVLGGKAIGGLLGIEATLGVQVMLIIALFSSIIGVFFGIYPARKAARLNPIEALRSE